MISEGFFAWKKTLAAALAALMLLAVCPAEAGAESEFPFLSWPNAHAALTGCYVDEVTRGHAHYGLDMIGDHDIHACAGGTVVVSRYFTAWGYTVMLRHDDLKVGDKYVYTMYAHMDSIDRCAKVGEWVSAGRQIGLMGNTGTRSEGVHLHLSVKLSADPDYVNIEDHPGQNVDPGLFLAVPEDLGEAYSSESTCCHDYYVGLMQQGSGTKTVAASGEGLNDPATIRAGGVLQLKGEIASSASTAGTLHHRARWITMARCTVTDATGNVVLEDCRFPNAAVFKIKDFRIPYAMRSFPAGTYRIAITARDEAGNRAEVVHKKVTVVEKARAEKPVQAALSPADAEARRRMDIASVTAFADALGTFSSAKDLTPERIFSGLEAMLFLDGDIRYADAEHIYDENGALLELRFSAAQLDALVVSLTGAPLPDAGKPFVQYPEAWSAGRLYGFVCEDGVYRAAATDYYIWTAVASAEELGNGVWRVGYARRYVFDDPDAPLSEEELAHLSTVRLKETDGGYGFTVLPG